MSIYSELFITTLQVHIVKPVMTRLKVLIDATQTIIEGRKYTNNANCSLHVCLGSRLLHFSWLCVIMKRAFVHESKTIIKWAVADFLTMPIDNSPLKQQEFWPVCYLQALYYSSVIPPFCYYSFYSRIYCLC